MIFTLSYFCGKFLPSWIWIRIQSTKINVIHADPDPDPLHCFKRKKVGTQKVGRIREATPLEGQYFPDMFLWQKEQKSNIGEKEGEGRSTNCSLQYHPIPSIIPSVSQVQCSLLTFINLLLQSSWDVRRRERFKFSGLWWCESGKKLPRKRSQKVEMINNSAPHRYLERTSTDI